jgi:hypothetical protein
MEERKNKIFNGMEIRWMTCWCTVAMSVREWLLFGTVCGGEIIYNLEGICL